MISSTLLQEVGISILFLTEAYKVINRRLGAISPPKLRIVVSRKGEEEEITTEQLHELLAKSPYTYRVSVSPPSRNRAAWRGASGSSSVTYVRDVLQEEKRPFIFFIDAELALLGSLKVPYWVSRFSFYLRSEDELSYWVTSMEMPIFPTTTVIVHSASVEGVERVPYYLSYTPTVLETFANAHFYELIAAAIQMKTGVLLDLMVVDGKPVLVFSYAPQNALFIEPDCEQRTFVVTLAGGKKEVFYSISELTDAIRNLAHLSFKP